MTINAVRLTFNALKSTGGSLFTSDIVKTAPTFSAAKALIQTDVLAAQTAAQTNVDDFGAASSLLNS